jgi:hypothetical protein
MNAFYHPTDIAIARPVAGLFVANSFRTSSQRTRVKASLTGSFIVPMPPGTTELLVFKRVAYS